jgi:hypothetical protein
MPRRKGCPFSGSAGYTTEKGRRDWVEGRGLGAAQDPSQPWSSFEANVEDPSAPLFYWQLYSLLGVGKIEALIRTFYRKVFDEAEDARDDPAWARKLTGETFRGVFRKVGPLEHHVSTQTQFWVDSFGGGYKYHGGDFRLNFHHENNAAAVMNEWGAKLWMRRMGDALVETSFAHIDPRIKPCIVGFLQAKVRKYAKNHGWRFDSRDFAFVARDPEMEGDPLRLAAEAAALRYAATETFLATKRAAESARLAEKASGGAASGGAARGDGGSAATRAAGGAASEGAAPRALADLTVEELGAWLRDAPGPLGVFVDALAAEEYDGSMLDDADFKAEDVDDLGAGSEEERAALLVAIVAARAHGV